MVKFGGKLIYGLALCSIGSDAAIHGMWHVVWKYEGELVDITNVFEEKNNYYFVELPLLSATNLLAWQKPGCSADYVLFLK